MDKRIVVKIVGTNCHYHGCNLISKYNFTIKIPLTDKIESVSFCENHFNKFMQNNKNNYYIAYSENNKATSYIFGVVTNFLITIRTKTHQIAIPWKQTGKRIVEKNIQLNLAAKELELICSGDNRKLNGWLEINKYNIK
jgi:hypothetical protein